MTLKIENKPLVSIVIPVYNTGAPLLKRCIDSVLNQTYENIEILIINDGSKYATRSLCTKLEKQHRSIVVIDQENQGVSAARNNGTNRSSGEYVMYVDGDDIISPFAVEEAVRFAIEDKADIVIGALQKVKAHDEFNFARKDNVKTIIYNKDNFDTIRKHYIALNESEFKGIDGNGYVNRGPYCRLIKKSIAISNSFPIGLPIGEDLIWNMSLLNKCDKICVVHSKWYCYLECETGAIHKYYGNRRAAVERYLKLLWDNNSSFCENNIDLYGKNIAVEYYCLLRYELMSPKCMMTKKEKNVFAKKTLHRKPWALLMDKRINNTLQRKYRMLLLLSRLGLWQQAMRVMY